MVVMKKLTYTRRRWLAWRQRREKRRQRVCITPIVLITAPRKRFFASQGRPWQMPAVLCLDENSVASVNILAEIQRRLLTPSRGNRRLRVSRRGSTTKVSTGPYRAFENLRRVTPAAALVLAAEYDRAREVCGIDLAVYNLAGWHPPVRATLQEIGFLALFGISDEANNLETNGGQVVLRMRSGSRHDPDQINDLVSSLRHLFPDREAENTAGMMQLFDALTEAVGNVIHHAYPASGGYRLPSVGRWWMTGAVDRKAGSTATAVYDQGVTIPGSLPDWDHYGGVVQRLLTGVGQSMGLIPNYRDSS